MGIGQELLNVPFPEMVYQLGLAIAQSQYKLDMSSIEILKVMGDKTQAPVHIPNFQIDSTNGGLVKESDGSYKTNEIVTSMIGAGFQPTFYQFAETIIEVKMTITMEYESSYENTKKGNETTTTSSTTGYPWWKTSSTTTVKTTPVDAKYSSKYNYNAEGSSLLRTRLVPTPPNPFIQKILDMRAQALQMEMEVEMRRVEASMEVEKAKIAANAKTEADKLPKE